uniref:Uncharacterized protein n=1 Tax=Cajanus cajan TaxID=3821 RepID=A0A151R5E8_CAJCA|nr:hypothetical protein KK1_040972 [Cajanus cajan]
MTDYLLITDQYLWLDACTKVVIPLLVDERQMAFVEGRGILQSVVILIESLDEVRWMRKLCIFFKIDFEKTYDSVSWSFLLYMLHRFGFDER